MIDDPLSPELRAAGARRRSGRAPETITADWLAEQTEQLERILRLQYPDGRLPPDWETELEMLSGDDTTALIRRWALLKHAFRVRSERLERADSESSTEAARALLRREPVVIWLQDHRVEVTGRSYSAMAEIAAHDAMRRKLDDDLEHVAALTGKARTRLRSLPWWPLGRRNAVRRHIRTLTDLYQRILTERERHRAAVYAHALTPSGAPAEDIDEALPPWWRETGPAEDAVLLNALFEAGPARYDRLGPEPPAEKGGAELREPMGFASLFAMWETEIGAPPGELYDRDLGQLLTALRAGRLTYPDRE